MQFEYHLILSIENTNNREAILNRFGVSEFLQFCIINEIFEEGMKVFVKRYFLLKPIKD